MGKKIIIKTQFFLLINYFSPDLFDFKYDLKCRFTHISFLCKAIKLKKTKKKKMCNNIIEQNLNRTVDNYEYYLMQKKKNKIHSKTENRAI